MKSSTDWEEERLQAIFGCGKIWPKINQLRAELHSYESAHDYFSAMRIEAERHLVTVIKLPPGAGSRGGKTSTDRMMKNLKVLTPERKRELVLALEGMG